MFIDDIVLAKGGFQAIIDDADSSARLGLPAADVRRRCGGGTATPTTSSLRDAQAAVDLLPDAELILRTEESHLGGFATADEVLAFIRSHL